MSGSDQEFMEALRAFEAGGAAGGVQGGAFGGAGVQAAGAAGGAGGVSDEEFFRALAAFGGPSMAAVSGAAAPGAEVMGAAPSLGQICSTYRSVKPVITGVLGFISHLPGIGGAAATAIRGLLAVLDAVCNGSATAAQLCERWRQVRPIVVRIVDAISHIPFIGGRAAAAIRALISALDTVCRFV